MLRFVLKRLAQAVLIILASLTVVFLVVRVAPGDPAALILGASASQSDIAALRTQLGLDEPLLRQYLTFLQGVAQGDFGTSWRLGGDALANVLERLPATLQLSAFALLITVAVGFPLGVLSARRAGSWIDRAISVPTLLGQALPTFWVGVMLILVFSRTLDVLPATANGTVASLVLPSVTLALPFLGWLARLVRNGVLEELGKDYVRTARAKGVDGRVVFYRHVVRNMMIPVVTLLGLLVGNFIANAVIIEVVFAWPGIGSLMIDSITNRDYSVVQAVIMTITVAYVLLNLLVDFLYVKLDPRLNPEHMS
ncbi:ABC transporter permease [Micromonospora siamensis]|uniref:Peptide/nickel transport system permease protein n=1 Tax=Micromonospora siamensis TaxID=299152 RepID=A0A1C5IPG0_9ACTN|nr:ABC transporter permease [Micromonospora siamensis]SCG59666.1 peptide/nickel transport system permease protein [Micromonospora siamensis]